MTHRVALPLALALGIAALGWNPVSYPGPPLRWSTAAPVMWNPDGGPLGMLSNAEANARSAEAFAAWDAVPTATIAYVQGGQIRDAVGTPVDVRAANYASILNLANGQNPIIYDNDREIFALVGKSTSVLGFAGALRTSGAQITKGYAVLQGEWIDGDTTDTREITVPQFVGVMVHEFGHFSGLGHTSVNFAVWQDGGLPGCPRPRLDQLETMSPFANYDMSTLHRDDVVGISSLYPTSAFQTTLAGIAGTVIAKNGVSPFDGANVVLRRSTTDCDLLYDEAQGTQSGVNPAETGGPGTFRFAGLTPGAAYTVAIATIDGGSYPVQDATGAPPSLDGPDEFYNGVAEGSFDPPDTPAAVTPIVAGAGGTSVPGIAVRINNAGLPGAIPGTGSDALRVGKLDGGTPLPPALLRLGDGSYDGAFGVSGTDRLAWIERFTPGPQDYPFRLERIDLQFVDPSAAAGRAIQLLVYVDPTGSGSPAASNLVATENATIQFLSATSYNEFPLAAPVTILSGDLYVGAIDLVADAGATNLIAALDSHPSGRAYYQQNGTSPAGFVRCVDPGGCNDWTWMIRASGTTLPNAGTYELTWGAACNAVALAGQDTAVYQGSLSALRATQNHVPIACSTFGARRWLLPGSAVPGDVYWLVAPLLADREGSLGTGTNGAPRPALETCETVTAETCP